MDTLTARRPTTASVAKVRSAFPALQRRHLGHPVAYFDGPGGTQVPQSVVEAMADYLLHHNANTHWQYPTSAETDALIASSRGALADLLGAQPNEIAFGANMTTLTFHLSRALGRSWGQGDTVVVTELDHHANVAPWRALERERGVTIAVVPLIPGTGQLDWEQLEALLKARPKLLVIGAASNALGTVNDIQRATELAHQYGAMTFVDAVHYVPHNLTDVRTLGCDFLACSAYKFCGPHVGVLYAREEILQQLDVPKLAPAPDRAPERIETGTLNHEGIVGAAAAVDFFASLSEGGTTRRDRLVQTYHELHVRGRALVERLWFGLQEIGGVTLYGPAPDLPRTPTVAFTLAGQPADAVAHRLAGLGLFVSSGDFYAATVVERLGVTEGLVRVGCACYTTDEEVERLVQGVRSLSQG
jgi:cysteine desulfurase family protein (TIGR01976 family)